MYGVRFICWGWGETSRTPKVLRGGGGRTSRHSTGPDMSRGPRDLQLPNETPNTETCDSLSSSQIVLSGRGQRNHYICLALFPYVSYVYGLQDLCIPFRISLGVQGATGSTAGVQFPTRVEIFSSPQLSDRLWGAPSLPPRVPGILSPGVERPGRDAIRSPPASAEANYGGAVLPLPRTSSCRGA
jgi:hypothetical protein